MFLAITFLVLLIIWGATIVPTPQPWAPGWLGGFVPWLCVAILGYVVFRGHF